MLTFIVRWLELQSRIFLINLNIIPPPQKKKKNQLDHFTWFSNN